MFFSDYDTEFSTSWFESDYYYPVSLGITKKTVGYLADFIGNQMIKRGKWLSVEQTTGGDA